MKRNFGFKALIGVFFMFAPLKAGFCDLSSQDLLVWQGKNALIESKDPYAADAKFAQAMLPPRGAAYQRACFWRAATIMFTDPLLKSTLKDLNILGGDNNEDFIALDEKEYPKVSFTPIPHTVIDNQDPLCYDEYGNGWVSLTTKNKDTYGADCRIHQAGYGTERAVWTPDIPLAGEYKVFVWIPFTADNAPEAKYAVQYDGGSAIVVKNQAAPCNVNRWVFLGQYKFTPGLPARIELSDEARSGKVVADAVKLKYAGEYYSENSSAVSLTGNWKEWSFVYAQGGSCKKLEAGSGGSCIWRPDIFAAGKYQISASWIAASENAPSVAYTISVPGKKPVTIFVDQRKGGFGYPQQQTLGFFDLQPGVGNSIMLSQNAGGQVTNDGIKIIAVRSQPDLDATLAIFTSLLTEIDQALGYLNNISADFSDRVNLHAVDNLGSPVWTEIDYGDALIFKAMLNFLKLKLNILLAYDARNLDLQQLVFVVPSELISVNRLLAQYPNLGNLKPDAVTRLSNAKGAFIASINSYINAYRFITAESDDQGDDLIKFDRVRTQMDLNGDGDFNDPGETTYQNGPDDQTKENIDQVISEFGKLLENLNGGPAYYFSSATENFGRNPQVSQDEVGYFKIALNLRNFFNYPKNLRDMGPRFDNKNNPIRSSVPDPTFAGILPGMTKAELNGIFDLGPNLERPLPSWNGEKVSIILTWDKDSYPDFRSYKVFRSTTDTVTENSLKVYDSTDKNKLTFIDTSLNSRQNVYYYRLYTYYANGDKIAGHIRRVTTKIYTSANNASGREDGSSQYPYRKLSSAVSSAGAGTRICVAQGSYTESERTLRFWGKPGIVLEGGYEAASWKRDIKAFPTVINATGLGSYAAVGVYNSKDITIDGFTIKGTQDKLVQICYANGIKIKNCTMSDGPGIGLYVSNAEVTIENCSISQNKAGIVSDNVTLTVSGCAISKNSQAGINIQSPSGTSKISDSLIKENDSGIVLGDILHKAVIINNNLLLDNKNSGVYCSEHADAGEQISNNTIMHSQNGLFWERAFFDLGYAPHIYNNIIISNGVGIHFKYFPSPGVAIEYNNVWSNRSSDYLNCNKGAHDICADPLFVNGPKGEYYLSQISAGQSVNSPCVDAGSTSATDAGLADYVTNSNYLRDTGAVDIGFHYASIARISTNPAAVNGVITGRSPLGVQFYADRSEGEIVSYLWNFGNGTTSNFANPGQTFENNSRTTKTYTVTLTVVDKEGTSASTTMQVKVKPRAMNWFGMGGD